MFIYKASDKLVFNILKRVKYGYLEITCFDGTLLKFGNIKDNLKANIIIKKPNFTYNLIRGGSIGFAECYMRGEFETDDLSNLIEFTARNINVVYKFSGLLDFPMINFIKNKIIKNTKTRSRENIAKHYDLGNDFFSLWLDSTLTYSSAIFEEQTKSLSEANFVAPYKLIGLLALSVESATTFLIPLSTQASITFIAPFTFVLIHSNGLYSAVGTIFVAAA